MGLIPDFSIEKSTGASGGIFIGHLFLYPVLTGSGKERRAMKGYNTENGYMGYVDGGYQLFASEADYLEWMED